MSFKNGTRQALIIGTLQNQNSATVCTLKVLVPSLEKGSFLSHSDFKRKLLLLTINLLKSQYLAAKAKRPPSKNQHNSSQKLEFGTSSRLTGQFHKHQQPSTSAFSKRTSSSHKSQHSNHPQSHH